MRIDSFGNRLCIHCRRALEADLSCRHCPGHVAGSQPEMTQRMQVCDNVCRGCGYHVCSCKPDTSLDGAPLFRDAGREARENCGSGLFGNPARAGAWFGSPDRPWNKVYFTAPSDPCAGTFSNVIKHEVPSAQALEAVKEQRRLMALIGERVWLRSDGVVDRVASVSAPGGAITAVNADGTVFVRFGHQGVEHKVRLAP